MILVHRSNPLDDGVESLTDFFEHLDGVQQFAEHFRSTRRGTDISPVLNKEMVSKVVAHLKGIARLHLSRDEIETGARVTNDNQDHDLDRHGAPYLEHEHSRPNIEFRPARGSLAYGQATRASTPH
jgi:hypothetical protein